MKENLVGKSFGIFTILYECEDLYSDGHKKYCAKCNICGKKFFKKLSDIKRTKTCRHNNTVWEVKRIGRIFNYMYDRCYEENDISYRWYGHRGIKICDEWLNNPKSFESWALVNGYKNDLTIDRKDENKDYSPDNCRWVTLSYNSKYKSTTRVLEVDGIAKTGREWADYLGFGNTMINSLLRRYPEEKVKEFIKRRLKNPEMKRKSKQSWMNVYGLED